MKFPIFVLFVFIVPFTAYSQDFNSNLFGGLSFSHLRGDNMDGYNKPGYQLGMEVGYEVKEGWTLWSGLGYVQKGSKATYGEFGNQEGGNWHLLRIHYVEIPLLLSYQMHERFDFGGGLYYGRKFGEFLEFIKGVGKESTEIIRDNDIGVAFRASYQLNDQWSFYLHHSNSIGSLVEVNTSKNLGQPTSGLRNMAVTLGLRLSLTK